VHLKQLLRFDIIHHMNEGIVNKKDSLYSFFEWKSASMKRLASALSVIDLEEKPSVAVIPLLMTYFGECDSTLLIQREVSNMSEVIMCSEKV